MHSQPAAGRAFGPDSGQPATHGVECQAELRSCHHSCQTGCPHKQATARASTWTGMRKPRRCAARSSRLCTRCIAPLSELEQGECFHGVSGFSARRRLVHPRQNACRRNATLRTPCRHIQARSLGLPYHLQTNSSKALTQQQGTHTWPGAG